MGRGLRGAAPDREAWTALEGVRQAGFEALEALRVEKGLPRFGLDYGPENFPQETGLEDAVSYTKGCYLGQEVVARIHYRGGVQKMLRGLVFEARRRRSPARRSSPTAARRAPSARSCARPGWTAWSGSPSSTAAPPLPAPGSSWQAEGRRRCGSCRCLPGLNILARP